MQSKKLGMITNSRESAFLSLLHHLNIPFQCIPFESPQLEIENFQALAILADKYPDIPANLERLQGIVKIAQEKSLPLYVEALPIQGLISNSFIHREYTRLVTRNSPHPILKGIEPMNLFETHQNPFLEMETPQAASRSYEELLTFGRVAGVYKADFGLPSETFLGLGVQNNMVFATIKLSDFDRMEYRLKIRFGQLLINICRFLAQGWWDVDSTQIHNPFDYRAYMEEMKGLSGAQRRQKYLQTVVDGLEWFEHAEMFVEPLGVGGVYEGFTSAFDHNGKKSYRFDDQLWHKIQRADCTADTGISFMLASRLVPEGAITPDLKEKYLKIGTNVFHELFDYWQHYPDNQTILRGFFGWANSPYDITVAYSDDNGRVTLESLLYAYILNDRSYFQRAYAAVNALRSTVGKNGHRWARIDLHHYYEKKGRKWFSKHKTPSHRYHSPHYDAWTFAAVLYGAYLIQDQEMVELIGKGISDYMKKFPKLPLEHSAGDDFSKLLVASVILYECTKNDAHLQYVHRIVDFFAQYQDPNSGAFPEIDPYKQHARTEKSNAKYGKGESALYTSPADTISDQLYSLGFLAMGLYFATKTGKCPKALSMLERLLDYLCMVQLRTPNPQLAGTWTRGFDFRFGEPYGANGDVGWGAYSIETGWTVGPILTSLLLYLLDFNPFGRLDDNLTQAVRSDYILEKEIQANLDGTWKAVTPKPIKHHTQMSPEQIKEVLKDFKCNSLGKK